MAPSSNFLEESMKHKAQFASQVVRPHMRWRLAQNALSARDNIRLGTNGRPRSASIKRHRADAIPRRRLTGW